MNQNSVEANKKFEEYLKKQDELIKYLQYEFSLFYQPIIEDFKRAGHESK